MRDKIMLTGAAIMDVMVVPAEKEVFETGSYPAEEISLSFGGDALNEAVVLSNLGKKVYLNAVLGKDSESEIIADYCKGNNVDISLCRRKKDIKTGINVVLVEKNGERNFLTNRNGSLRKLTIEDIPKTFPEDVKILCFASIFVFPEIKGKELAEIFQRAKEQGVIVCADMTKRKNKETVADIAEALSYVDYLMPNEEEAFLVTGKNTAEEAAEIFREAGVKNVIIKCGKRGCYINYAQGKMWIAPEKQVTAVDTTGAGDSFAAGFVYGISEGWSIEKCAKFANQCGAKAVGYVGAATWCKANNM